MYSFAMLFPGQGSQYIGMLSSFFYKNDNIIKQTFKEASHYIKYDLLKLITEGPKEKLNQNKYTQAAILTSSVSIYRLWNSKNGISPLLMSGHSLGEYSALVCSNAMKFSDALKIVFLRGKLMEKTSINRPALMNAIIGIDKKIVQTACAIYSKKQVVSLASINSHDQIVISGDKNAVYKTSLKCKKFGAKNIFNLNINIAAHSELMKPICEKLNKILKVTVIRPPKIPIINNVDVKFENTGKKIKNALIRQIYSTVRWQEIINLIELKKIFMILEVGPNKILTNLNKKNKNFISFSTNNLKNFLIAFKKINKGSYEKKQKNGINYRG
ncbi:MAG: ACP S-malonyltransferase [Buchnera aphidicola (Brevicoryne brassicae)]|uniref:Malonyl CoA-acyl carrier protein transacylase n=1 Tax=Buchnera aphidicola (Brevicoryne brassicae) TaxID=911343 RepID=A0AAJ5PVA1_9GAMM|nr:ACP S-malonyltransferase [Buchnera aphidicola]QCI19910.1 [acyl-carrier-protein] S-malonyltransferase [Buchnera aphidicola (Brevicoryne brassicae)]WAI18733.1 MAG: ACP S-malonyltransferase [Buchnera aphidicola (Brevicoryne brassicae)]